MRNIKEDTNNMKIMNIYCEVCGKYLSRDGMCNDCGLPAENSFLRALEQAMPDRKIKELEK